MRRYGKNIAGLAGPRFGRDARIAAPRSRELATLVIELQSLIHKLPTIVQGLQPWVRMSDCSAPSCWRRSIGTKANASRMTARILIVDDVPANTRLLEAKLSAEYYQVASARDGFEALRLAREWQPDLVLLDVMMPGMDGFECCRKLKNDPNTLHIPVVM